VNSHSPSLDVSVGIKSARYGRIVAVSPSCSSGRLPSHKRTRPKRSRLADDKAYMLWALLHLTCQIYGGCHNEIRVGLPDFDFGIKTANIELRRRKGLLAYLNSST
jgi:hypothetical protein